MILGKVLVTGATGDTGRATVNELLARSQQMRTLAHGQVNRSEKPREQGVEVVHGDHLDFGPVRAALNGRGPRLIRLFDPSGYPAGDKRTSPRPAKVGASSQSRWKFVTRACVGPSASTEKCMEVQDDNRGRPARHLDEVAVKN